MVVKYLKNYWKKIKKKINFVFGDLEKRININHDNKYADFINKYFDEITFAMCLKCL